MITPPQTEISNTLSKIQTENYCVDAQDSDHYTSHVPFFISYHTVDPSSLDTHFNTNIEDLTFETDTCMFISMKSSKCIFSFTLIS